MLVLAEGILNIFAVIVGACIFSFLNVVIYRVPNHVSFVKGHSICTTCGHKLNGLDMVPIFSWLCLGGKCRYCKAKISPRYMLVEAIGAVLALCCVLKYDYTLSAILAFAFLAMLTVVAFVDLDTMEIPDGFHIVILILAIAAIFAMPQTGIIARLIGAVCVSIPLLVITIIIPGGFGGGDIKLMAVSGFFLGWQLTLLAFFLAVVGGGIYGACLLAAKKKERKDHFAFGPFLCLAMGVSLFLGEGLLHWYLGFLPGI